jgi:hypothetical protein
MMDLRSLTGRSLRRRYLTSLTLALVVSIGSRALAQGRQTGTLRGVAHDSTRAILPGVTVTVTSAALQGTRSTTTDWRRGPRRGFARPVSSSAAVRR